MKFKMGNNISIMWIKYTLHDFVIHADVWNAFATCESGLRNV